MGHRPWGKGLGREHDQLLDVAIQLGGIAVQGLALHRGPEAGTDQRPGWIDTRPLPANPLPTFAGSWREAPPPCPRLIRLLPVSTAGASCC
jgi:hypothetical protein